MSKQRNDKESTIYFTPKPSQSFFVNRKQKKNFFKEKGEWRIEQKMKRKAFLTALATAIKKDPTTLIRKHANELKFNEKNCGEGN